jgi:hypothetical protein
MAEHCAECYPFAFLVIAAFNSAALARSAM